MPKLLSVQMMDERQRQHPRVVNAVARMGACCIPAGELPWRVCLWWKNDGSRPTDSHGYVLLGREKPREVLLTTVIGPGTPEADTGRALLAAARHALDQDVLDAKRPLLVLSDWLEEHGFPQHTLLRAFCDLKQGWLPRCLEGHAGATLDREALRAGQEGG